MPTFKICVFKDQIRQDGKYRVSIRLSHNRESAYLNSGIYILPKNISADFKNIRDANLIRRIDQDIIKYETILLRELGANLNRFSAKELVTYIQTYTATDGGANIDFIAFSDAYIAKLKATGHKGSAGRFESVIRNLIDYFGRSVVFIKEINVKNLQGFIEYMHNDRTITRINQFGKEVSTQRTACKDQTIKDYIADIHTLFNKVCEEYNGEDASSVLITHNPFHSKKLQIEVKDEPQKRDLSTQDLTKILTTETVPGHRMQLARDVLALSFYLQAMNTADLYGADAALAIRRINYHRQKTSPRRKDEAFFSVKIEPEALPLLKKYRDPKKKRLFCFANMYSNFRGFNSNVNKGCRQLAEFLNISCNLTTYYMRHTLATIASEECGISDADVALLLNHMSEDSGILKGRSLKITQGYIHRRFTKNDINHRKILDHIQEAIKKAEKGKASNLTTPDKTVLQKKGIRKTN